MNLLTRRQAFKAFVHGLVQTAGSVVVASCIVPTSGAQAATATPASPTDLQQRANQLSGDLEQQARGMLGGAFRNAFANGGFRNGGFRNAAFANGGFRNAGFANAGFRNGGFANAGFRNF
jgi:hypothetical protein